MSFSSEVVEERAVFDVLVDHDGLLELDAAAEEADEAAVVDLAEDSDLVEDLVGAFGVAELGALDGHGGAVLEEALVDIAVAAGAEEAVFGEVVGRSFDLFACEDFGGSSSGAVGIEYLFPLLGEALLSFFNAPMALVEEGGDGGDDKTSSNAGG